MKRFILLVVVLLVFAFSLVEGKSVRAATPVLLAEIDSGGETSFGYEPTIQEINAMVFVLGYGLQPTLIPDQFKWVLNSDVLIGNDVVLHPGQGGIFVFNASNTPGFNELTARLTNGIDEELSWGQMFVNDAYPLIAIAGPSYVIDVPESSLFDTSPNYVGPDLVGAQIEFIRLVVKKISFTLIDYSGSFQIIGSWDALWQIYGTPPPIIPHIKITPATNPYCINHNGHGVIPVVVFSSRSFDATQVDPTSVSLDGQRVRQMGNGNLQAHTDEDVDSDGFNDLVVQIEEIAGTYRPGENIATLTGETYDGIPIRATDSICILP